jgi:hypothetical protein
LRSAAVRTTTVPTQQDGQRSTALQCFRIDVDNWRVIDKRQLIVYGRAQ